MAVNRTLRVYEANCTETTMEIRINSLSAFFLLIHKLNGLREEKPGEDVVAISNGLSIDKLEEWFLKKSKKALGSRRREAFAIAAAVCDRARCYNANIESVEERCVKGKRQLIIHLSFTNINDRDCFFRKWNKHLRVR